MEIGSIQTAPTHPRAQLHFALWDPDPAYYPTVTLGFHIDGRRRQGEEKHEKQKQMY